MKNLSTLLEMVEVYKEETLWHQMVKVNVPNSKNICMNNNFKRLVAEFHFISNFYNNQVINEKIEAVCEEIINNQLFVLSDQDLHNYEAIFMEFSEEIKSYKVHLVSHAHIDMNWMWGYQETVEVVIDTIKTMLKLMKEYPLFKYSHSQASTYKILEEFAPELIDEIKYFIKNNQFEVSASTWVEKDSNMISTDSAIQHYQQTRKYLTKLLDLNADDFYMEFAPDTFGHNIETAKFLKLANLKYYYHCRGLVDKTLYRYKSLSGHEVIAFREPRWYANSIHATCFGDICNDYDTKEIKDYLYVYGVGDHGGGPTIRDIKDIMIMQNWPLIPTLEFSTHKNYFGSVEKYREILPVHSEELNFTLNGCFVSSTRMKQFNKVGENVIKMSNFSDALCNEYQLNTHMKNDDQYIQKVLFNQFHDILPGCGTLQTKEYAGGEFQNVLAYFNNKRKHNYIKIGEQIDTTHIIVQHNDDTSIGAGVGSNPGGIVDDFGVSTNLYLSHNCVASGDKRIYTIFNAASYSYKKQLEIIIWDYDVTNIGCKTLDGKDIDVIVINKDYHQYWGHHFTKVLVEVELPSLGFMTVYFYEKEGTKLYKMATDQRINVAIDYSLENNKVKVNLNPLTLAIDSVVKDNNIIAQNGNFVIKYEEEDGCSAWGHKRYTKIENQSGARNVNFVKNEFFQEVTFETTFDNTVLNVSYKLPRESEYVQVKVDTKWNFINNNNDIATLGFSFDVSNFNNYINDVPGGYLSRSIKNETVPGLNFCKIGNEEANFNMLSKEKYGYYLEDNKLTHLLIRNTNAPDTHPENYHHFITFSFGYATLNECIKQAEINCAEIEVINIKSNQKGSINGFGSLGESDDKLKIQSIYVNDNQNQCYRYLALEDVKMQCNDDMQFVDIYGNVLAENKYTELSKFDIQEIEVIKTNK